MKVKVEKQDSFYWPWFHRFPSAVRDLGDYCILLFWWEFRIYKNDNPWGKK